MNWQNGKTNNQKGFSLFEVMIAMSIMASAAILLYVSWQGNQVRVQKMAINIKAAYLLDQIMQELQIKYAQRIQSIPDSDEGVFEEEPRYRWSMKSQEFEMPDLRSVLVQGGDGDEMMLLLVDKLTEYLNQSIRELQVTVTYTIGKKSVKYTATTFMVDYNQQIPIPSFGGGGGLPGSGG